MRALSEIEKVRERIDRGVKFHEKRRRGCPECKGTGLIGGMQDGEVWVQKCECVCE